MSVAVKLLLEFLLILQLFHLYFLLVSMNCRYSCYWGWGVPFCFIMYSYRSTITDCVWRYFWASHVFIPFDSITPTQRV